MCRPLAALLSRIFLPDIWTTQAFPSNLRVPLSCLVCDDWTHSACDTLSMQRDDLTLLYPSADMPMRTWCFYCHPPVCAHRCHSPVHASKMSKSSSRPSLVFDSEHLSHEHRQNVFILFTQASFQKCKHCSRYCNVHLFEHPETRNKSTAINPILCWLGPRGKHILFPIVLCMSCF